MSKKLNDGSTEKLVWTKPMDKTFMEAMIKEQNNGNRVDGTFTPQAYSNMVDELSKAFGKELTKDHSKNRLRTLKDHFALFYDVFRGVAMSGFSWDPTTKLLGAEDDVWETLISEKPEATKWRTKPIYHYNEMLELFARDRATGAGAETAKERNKRSKENAPTVETIEELDHMVETNDIHLETFSSADDIPFMSPTPQGHAKLPSSSSKKKRKMEQDDQFTVAIMSSINNVADAIDRSIKVMETSRPHVYSGNEIFKGLQDLGLRNNELFKAYRFLVQHPKDAEAVFGCPLDMRMTFLESIMESIN